MAKSKATAAKKKPAKKQAKKLAAKKMSTRQAHDKAVALVKDALLKF